MAYLQQKEGIAAKSRSVTLNTLGISRIP
jgi:hypothetical protein